MLSIHAATVAKHLVASEAVDLRNQQKLAILDTRAVAVEGWLLGRSVGN